MWRDAKHRHPDFPSLFFLGLRYDTDMETALYIHFPFCVRKCPYCDFNSVAGSPIAAADYVAAVVGEMKMRARLLDGAVRSRTLYLGGGTPSLMAPDQVALLIDTAARAYNLAADAEITLEANPGTLTAASLAGFRAAGVNRLSLGVQSFHDRFLAMLGRVHSAAAAVAAVAAARKAGFDNIGIDLIHSLPREDLLLWQKDLEQAASLSPEHISVYGLTVEAGTPFEALENDGLLTLPSEEDSAQMLERASSFLDGNGYRQYEIANFSRPGFTSRHNTTYWRRGTYLGFGAGAHSFLREPFFGRRWKNCDDPATYIAVTAVGDPCAEEVTELTKREAMGEFLFLGLRLLEGVDTKTFLAEFGVPVEAAFPAEVAWLLKNGLLERRGDFLRLTARALPVANQVFMRFV